MNSIVVHYQEIALKGKNRPWFLGRLVRNLRARVSRPRRHGGARADGPDRDRARARRDAARRSASASGGRSASPTSRYARPHRARPRRASPRRSSRDLGDRTCDSFRVSARRADKRFPLTSPQVEREVGGRIKEARGWTRRSRARRARHPRRAADRTGVLLLRQGARGRAACRPAPPAAWCACCRAASIRRWPRTA